MAVVKVVNRPYVTLQDMYNLICYVVEKAEYVGGCGLSLIDIESVVYEFEVTKILWEKEEEGRRQVRHVIVSLESDKFSIEDTKKVAWKMAEYFGMRHQVIYGVHDDTQNPHIHFVINTVSFLDGQMISEGWNELDGLKNIVEIYCSQVKEEEIAGSR